MLPVEILIRINMPLGISFHEKPLRVSLIIPSLSDKDKAILCARPKVQQRITHSLHQMTVAMSVSIVAVALAVIAATVEGSGSVR